ncbi:MAG: enoyl-CoA hydratase/isomerase family protein, partial [Acidimicrobiales bacterium]
SMPPKKALELMATGRRVGADEAQRIGFVTRVVSRGQLDEAVDELAVTLAAKPAGVMKLGRDAFYSVWDLPARAALDHLQSMLTITMMTDEATEGLRAFAEKRAPSWNS